MKVMKMKCDDRGGLRALKENACKNLRWRLWWRKRQLWMLDGGRARHR
jgi:hypothetical protein